MRRYVLSVTAAAIMVGSCASSPSLSENSQGAAMGVITGRAFGPTVTAAVRGANGTGGAAIGAQMDQLASKLQSNLRMTHVQRYHEGIILVIETRHLFYNVGPVQGEGRRDLLFIAEAIHGYPGAELIIVAHNHGRETAAGNLQLSQERATAVRDWLKRYLADFTIRAEGRGQTEPVIQSGNSTFEDHRIEIGIYAGPNWPR